MNECDFATFWGKGYNFGKMFAWIESFKFLSGNGAVLLILATAVFILLIPDVRLALAGLAVQYFGLMLLYATVIDPRLALMKLSVGWFVCLILLVTGQQVRWGQTARVRPVRLGEKEVSVTAVRGVLALVMLIIVWLLAQQNLPFALPESVAYLNVAVYGLVGFGLLGVFTASEQLLRAGMGVLMLLAGLELYYTVATQDQSLTGIALMAVLNLAVALIVAALVQKRYATTVTSFK